MSHEHRQHPERFCDDEGEAYPIIDLPCPRCGVSHDYRDYCDRAES